MIREPARKSSRLHSAQEMLQGSICKPGITFCLQVGHNLLKFSIATQSLEVCIFIEGIGVFQTSLDRLSQVLVCLLLIAARNRSFCEKKVWPRLLRSNRSHQLKVKLGIGEMPGVLEFSLPGLDSLHPQLIERTRKDRSLVFVLGMVSAALEGTHSVGNGVSQRDS